MSLELFSLSQWPAFMFGLVGSLFVASHLPQRRLVGFACFLVSNIFWLIWGYHVEGQALIMMQVCFIVTSIRGYMLSKKFDGEQANKEREPRYGAIPIES